MVARCLLTNVLGGRRAGGPGWDVRRHSRELTCEWCSVSKRAHGEHREVCNPSHDHHRGPAPTSTAAAPSSSPHRPRLTGCATASPSKTNSSPTPKNAGATAESNATNASGPASLSYPPNSMSPLLDGGGPALRHVLRPRTSRIGTRQITTEVSLTHVVQTAGAPSPRPGSTPRRLHCITSFCIAQSAAGRHRTVLFGRCSLELILHSAVA